jgi:predicted nucleic acid-binding Zn finger protein
MLWSKMNPAGDSEALLIAKICKEIESRRSLEKNLAKKLEESFGERYEKALDLVERVAIKRYLFKPSGRVIWEVRGKNSTYQVMPHTNFCNCDDYYFRVMNAKKQLCYHIIAQKIALALGRFEKEENRDIDYGRITRRWKKTIK